MKKDNICCLSKKKSMHASEIKQNLPQLLSVLQKNNQIYNKDKSIIKQYLGMFTKQTYHFSIVNVIFNTIKSKSSLEMHYLFAKIFFLTLFTIFFGRNSQQLGFPASNSQVQPQDCLHQCQTTEFLVFRSC